MSIYIYCTPHHQHRQRRCALVESSRGVNFFVKILFMFVLMRFLRGNRDKNFCISARELIASSGSFTI